MIKPSNTWHLLPLFICIIGLAVAYFVFISPRALFKEENISQVVVDRSYEVELNRGDYITLYLDDADSDDINFSKSEDQLTVYYSQFTYDAEIAIVITDENSEIANTLFTVNDNSFYAESYLCYQELIATESGTYNITFLTDDIVEDRMGFLVVPNNHYTVPSIIALGIAIFSIIASSMVSTTIVNLRKKYLEKHQIYNELDDDGNPILDYPEDNNPYHYL